MSIDRAEMDRRWFAYFYDGDDFNGALINKFCERDPKRLQHLEYRVAQARAYEILEGKFDIPQTFDLDHYLAIHRALLSDVYPWAGTVRDVDLVKAGHSFADFETVHDQFSAATDIVRNTDWPHLPRDKAMATLGEVYKVVNESHPAREGNGRATRMFMRDVAAQAGYEFHEGSLSRHQLVGAAIAGHEGDMAPLTAMFTEHCTLGPSRAQQLAAASATPPSTTLRQRLDRLYSPRGSDAPLAPGSSLSDRVARLASPTAALDPLTRTPPHPAPYRSL